MMKSKIIFDVFVEEMARQRVMRQFGLLQLETPPPTEAPLSRDIHRITKKGINRTAAEWLVTLQPYVTQWETASTHLWHENHGFEMDKFNLYLQQYMTGTRLCIVHHTHLDEIPAPTTTDMYPSYDTSGSRQHTAELTRGLGEEVSTFQRSLSSAPLMVPLAQVQTWMSRIEGRLRSVYQAITCTRTSDIQQPLQRPPRHSMHQQQPRHSTGQLEPTHHRHEPRPRRAEQWTATPPPPDQAGSLAWQHQPDPTSRYVFRPGPQQQSPTLGFMIRPSPTGYYRYQTYGHDASMSGSGWDSDHEHITQDFVSQHNDWTDTFMTPAPHPTQETQDDQEWSELPPRNVGAPHRFMWTTPPPPPPRRAG